MTLLKNLSRHIKTTSIALAAAVALSAAPDAQAEKRFVTIGTGSVTGVYYPAGGAICRLVNRGRKEHGIRCSVESTGGSIYNINAIRNEELDLGVAQSDWQYHAMNGSSDFEKLGAFKDLRALFSLHSEPFTILARADAEIESFEDLKGKRVNIGNPGSGTRATMDMVMAMKGWTKDDFKFAAELKASEVGQALCDNKIDAFVHAVGHPNSLVQEATTTCESQLVSMDEATVDELVEQHPYYAKTFIPGGMYNGNAEETLSFGAKATFVTSANLDEDIAYEVVKAVFDNFDNFRTLHPVFSSLLKENMVTDGNTALLHPGAERFFNEAGLLSASATKAADEAAVTEEAAE